MTHPHADHIGGMQAVLDAFPVDRAVLPDFAKAPMPTTSTFLNLLDAIREKQIPTVTARAEMCSRWEKGRSRCWATKWPRKISTISLW